MKTYIALLRGINVGGSTSLPMAELRSICSEIGFKNVRTYIQSGNILFESEDSEEALIKKLEEGIEAKKQKHIPAIIRTIEEMRSVLARNPFPDAKPSQVGVTFFAKQVANEVLEKITTPGREEVKISGRELFIHYPDGMGRSKLKLPKEAQGGTVRNINTVNKLIEMGGRR